MTPIEMAKLHARAATTGRAWTAEEYRSVLETNGAFSVSHKTCFALGRVIADEAELLQIATNPDHQRQGLGRTTLLEFEDSALKRGATTAFLEVSATNEPAIALYINCGWTEAGLRKAYYLDADGFRHDALIYKKHLNQLPH